MFVLCGHVVSHAGTLMLVIQTLITPCDRHHPEAQEQKERNEPKEEHCEV